MRLQSLLKLIQGLRIQTSGRAVKYTAVKCLEAQMEAQMACRT